MLCYWPCHSRAHDSRAGSAPWTVSMLDVAVNDESYPVTHVWQDATGAELLVPVARLREWRLRVPERLEPVVLHDEPCLALASLPGVRWKIDTRAQRLVIDADPAALTTTEIAATRAPARTTGAAAQRGTGAFMNYDLTAMRTGGGSAAHAGGFFDLVGFGSLGTFSQSWIAANTPLVSHLLRLDSTWSMDQPVSMRTIRVGDTVSQSTPWGTSYRFAGIQVMSNFGTRPEIGTIPLPSIGGEAALPSVAQLYVNGALQGQQKLPSGPFVINNIPVVTGQGQIQLVVTDVLGHQQLISAPFYNAATLLKSGLTQYSFEAGLLRNNYGQRSADYGTPVISATYRRGMTDDWTARMHTDVTSRSAMSGADSSFALPFASINIGAAVSDQLHPAPGLANVGYAGTVSVQRNLHYLSVQFSAFAASLSFVPPGISNVQNLSRRQLTGTGSYSFGRAGNLSVTYAALAYARQSATSLASIGYSMAIGDNGYLNAGISRQFGASGARSVSLLYTRPLSDHGLYASAGFLGTYGDADSDSRSAYGELVQPLPLGDGVGYHLRADSARNT
ncbi:conserved hypothetical protein, partial [Ricinus communis]